MSSGPLVPESQDGLDKMKIEYANEIGTKFDDSYKGNISSKLNGHIGGPVGGMMVKKMIEDFEKNLIDK